jgi:hypothetical protein
VRADTHRRRSEQKAQKRARVDVHILEVEVVAAAGLDRVLPGIPAPMPHQHHVSDFDVVIPIRHLKAVVAQIDRALVVGILLLVEILQ